MRKILFAFLFFASVSGWTQAADTLGLAKPSEGKAMVYFVRSSSLGFLINFKYFDGETYLGKFNHGKYLAYECAPGKHLFWSKSENTDYLEAELEAGKIYIIDAEPQMGAIKAGVKLVPYDNNPSNYKTPKKYERKRKAVFKAITNGKAYTLSEEDRNDPEIPDIVKRGMEKYKSKKDEGKTFPTLPADMDFKE